MTIKSFTDHLKPRAFTNGLPLRGERIIVLNQPVKVDTTPAPVTAADQGEPALLRPGQEVRVSGLLGNTVVVKSPRLLKPGLRSELQLTAQRRVLRGAFDCRISQSAPLCYEATFVFDQSAEMSEANHV